MRAPSSGHTMAAVAAQAISAAMIQKLIGMEVVKSPYSRIGPDRLPRAGARRAGAASGERGRAEAALERLEKARAGLELGDLDVLVRLVRDGDVARAADHRGHAGGHEEARFGAEAHPSRD